MIQAFLTFTQSKLHLCYSLNGTYTVIELKLLQSSQTSSTTDTSVLELELNLELDDLVIFPHEEVMRGGKVVEVNEGYVKIALRGDNANFNLDQYMSSTFEFRGDEREKLKPATMFQVVKHGNRVFYGDRSVRFLGRMLLLRIVDRDPVTLIGSIQAGTKLEFQTAEKEKRHGILMGVVFDLIDRRKAPLLIVCCEGSILEIPLVRTSEVKNTLETASEAEANAAFKMMKKFAADQDMKQSPTSLSKQPVAKHPTPSPAKQPSTASAKRSSSTSAKRPTPAAKQPPIVVAAKNSPTAISKQPPTDNDEPDEPEPASKRAKRATAATERRASALAKKSSPGRGGSPKQDEESFEPSYSPPPRATQKKTTKVNCFMTFIYFFLNA
jgi:hypothetical protein